MYNIFYFNYFYVFSFEKAFISNLFFTLGDIFQLSDQDIVVKIQIY